MFDASGNPIHIGLTRTTDASVPVLTTAEMKLALKIDVSTDDTLIDALVEAATHKVEADTKRALINQTWTMTLDKAPSGRQPILLPVGPVSSITSLKSFSVADVEATIATSVYRLDSASSPARVVLKDAQDWATDLRPQNGLQVVFVAGYGAASTNVTDTALIHAVRLLVSHWYENRIPVSVGESATEVPLAYHALIHPMVIPWL